MCHKMLYLDIVNHNYEVAMRKQLFKIASMAALMLALTSTAFAQESSGGGFRIGFYGSLPAGNMAILEDGRDVRTVGALFDIGNGLEFGLGIGFYNYSHEVKITASGDTQKNSRSAYEIIPSASYAFSRGDVISWGAGLDVHMGSYSQTNNNGGTSTTTEPDGVDLAFVPNFFVKAEVAKNLVLGLKAGFGIELPSDQQPAGQEVSTTIIGLGTELFLAFYL